MRSAFWWGKKTMSLLESRVRAASSIQRIDGPRYRITHFRVGSTTNMHSVWRTAYQDI
jgi:hypothetical protein